MEQNNTSKPIKKAVKKTDSTAIRFDKAFMRQIARLVDRANKKPFGRKVKPKAILENLLKYADEKLLENVVKQAQEDSLTHTDKRELFLKEKLSKFSGSKEQLELKMMEVFDQYLSQNPV